MNATTIKVTKTTTRQDRYETRGLRRYVSWCLRGSCVETKALVELTGNARTIAAGDWPRKTFDQCVDEINRSLEKEGIL